MSTLIAPIPSPSTTRLRRRSGGPSRTARLDRERLPLAKDLAAVLGVNKNTVLAIDLLREEGRPEFRCGRGITVVGTPQRGAVLARLGSSSSSPGGTASGATTLSR